VVLDEQHCQVEVVAQLAEECAKLGLEAVVAPAGTTGRGKLRILEAETLREAAKAAIDAGPAERG